MIPMKKSGRRMPSPVRAVLALVLLLALACPAQALASSYSLLGEGKRVIFVSKDINARLKADALGIDPSRITTVSYGKERPAALGSDEAAWAQNRRAVTVTIQY